MRAEGVETLFGQIQFEDAVTLPGASLIFSSRHFEEEEIPAAEMGVVEQAWQEAKSETSAKRRDDESKFILILDSWTGGSGRGGWWGEVFQVGAGG